MIVSIFYVFLAVLGLSFLIFIHELGHYFMARRVGMRVEVFAIGFGKPIYSWIRDGVKWQVGWLLFGGYVKIAGQDGDETVDPYTVPDGFFGKSPLDRIKVALAGPILNLILAFLFFTVIWATGGRDKHFADFTKKIGWVDPQSELYAAGIRPGDEILEYNHVPYESSKDHLYAPMTHPGQLSIKGNKVDYATGVKTPFEQTVKTYSHPSALEKGIVTAGILAPANYIMYDVLPGGKENPLPEGSPMKNSGIEYGDKIVWVDGDLVFSGNQLSQFLNNGRVLLTVQRDGAHRLVRVPRIYVEELKMDHEFREELTDWQYEANLKGTKIQKLYMIPYNLTNGAVVENEMRLIESEKEKDLFPEELYSSYDAPLKVNDQIIAVDGVPVTSSYELLAQLQQHRVNIIVERNPHLHDRISMENADADWDQSVDWVSIQSLADSIGMPNRKSIAGNYVLLSLVTPVVRSDFVLSPETQANLALEMQEQKKAVEAIEDPEKRSHALALLQKQDKQLLLGLPAVQDRHVTFNPSPVAQFTTVFSEIWRTLVALVTGSLNPKWVSGPLGIVQVVHDHWMIGIKEALFWLGAISLNLGLLNLLPIPVLDGGTVALSLFELITGKRIPAKTMEKVIFPFALLLIGFFIFLTYQDLSRILTKFFGM